VHGQKVPIEHVLRQAASQLFEIGELVPPVQSVLPLTLMKQPPQSAKLPLVTLPWVVQMQPVNGFTKPCVPSGPALTTGQMPETGNMKLHRVNRRTTSPRINIGLRDELVVSMNGFDAWG